MVKPDRVFACAILDETAKETWQVEKVSNTVYKMSKEWQNDCLRWANSYQIYVCKRAESVKVSDAFRKVEKLNKNVTHVERCSEKYTYAVGGDKQIQTLLWLQLKAFTEEKTNRNWTWIKNFFRRHCDPYLSYLKCLKHLYAILWTPALQYLPNPWKWRTSREH